MPETGGSLLSLFVFCSSTKRADLVAGHPLASSSCGWLSHFFGQGWITLVPWEKHTCFPIVCEVRFKLLLKFQTSSVWLVPPLNLPLRPPQSQPSGLCEWPKPLPPYQDTNCPFHVACSIISAPLPSSQPLVSQPWPFSVSSRLPHSLLPSAPVLIPRSQDRADCWVWRRCSTFTELKGSGFVSAQDRLISGHRAFIGDSLEDSSFSFLLSTVGSSETDRWARSSGNQDASADWLSSLRDLGQSSLSVPSYEMWVQWSHLTRWALALCSWVCFFTSVACGFLSSSPLTLLVKDSLP